MREHGSEPLPGLPGQLPEGETLLWQGSPAFRSFALRAMHLRKLAIYFAIVVAWYVAWAASSGEGWREGAIGSARAAGLALAALGLVALFAWLVARTTVYTLTSRRVVIRFGLALPMTLNLPFRMIEGAGLREFAEGTGDIPLALLPENKVAYLILWPHARPWRLARPEPSLRAVPDAARVARLLARALAASAEQPAQGVAAPVAKTGPRVRATAAA